MGLATPVAAAAPIRQVPSLGRRRHLHLIRRRILVWSAVGLLLVVVIYPQLWVILSSFKTQTEFLSEPTWSLPSRFDFDNYSTALTRGNIGTNYRNSITVTLTSLVLMISLGLAAAYTLEIMVWKGRRTLLLLFLAGMMVPGQMILVPLFIGYFEIGITNTLWPLILTYTVMGLPLVVFLMAAYFRTIPREIFEAATVDGAGAMRSFFSIGIPMMKNAILTLSLVEFFSVWNDLLIALTFTTRRELATVPVGLLSFSDEFGRTEYGPMFAAISVNIVVLLVLFILLNKKIIAGLASGSVKG